jgi:hypothetical protein
MAALKAAGALMAILLVLPATAAADPVGEGGFFGGANPNQIILDLNLREGGPVQFGAFEFPVNVTGATQTAGPQGTTCGPDAGSPATMRCRFGGAGWGRGQRVTVTVDTDAPVNANAQIPWRLSEDGFTDHQQSTLRKMQVGNLSVDVLTTASWRRGSRRMRVVEYVFITNNGPDASTGGILIYTHPNLARPRPSGTPAVVTIPFGAIAPGQTITAGEFRYTTLSGTFVSTVNVVGNNDPFRPDAARGNFDVRFPGTRITPPPLAEPRAPVFIQGEAFDDRQVMQLPPPFDPVAGNRLDRVEVAIRKQRKAGGKCRWLRKSESGFKRKKCGKPVWHEADGLEEWELELEDGLPRGKYVVIARAVNVSGARDTTFSAAEGNRVKLRAR